MGTEPSQLERVIPMLSNLSREARLAAFRVCFYYAIPYNPSFEKENQLERDRVWRARRALRKLRTHLGKIKVEIERTFEEPMMNWCDSITATHHGIPVLLPGLSHYFRQKDFMQKGSIDPTSDLDMFVNILPKLMEFAKSEIKYLGECHHDLSRSLRRKYAQHFQCGGRFEYTLAELFRRFARPKILRKDIEKRIDEIRRRLDGCVRGDVSAGTAAREQIRRVRKNPKIRRECDSYLKVNVGFPRPRASR